MKRIFYILLLSLSIKSMEKETLKVKENPIETFKTLSIRALLNARFDKIKDLSLENSKEDFSNFFKSLNLDLRDLVKEIANKPINNTGETFLQRSIRNGEKNITEILINLIKVDVNAEDNFGISALMLASFAYPDIVSLLLKNQADVNAIGPNRKTAIFFAVNNFESFNLLIGAGADLEQIDNLGDNILIQAILAKNFDLRILELLVDKGIDINYTTQDGVRPVLLAAQNNPEALKFLIDKVAQVFVADQIGKTTLMYAAANPESIKILSNYIEKNKFFRGTIWAVDNFGRSALHYAVLSGNPEALKLLLSLQLNHVNEQDNDGNTALHLAVLLNKNENVIKQIVELLLNSKIDVFIKNHNQNTPLDIAKSKRLGSIAKILGKPNNPNVKRKLEF